MRVPVESCNQGSRLVAFVPCLVPWPIAPLLPRLTVLPGVLSLPSFPGSFRALTWPSLSIRLAFPGPFILFSFPLASLKPKTAAFFFPVHNHVPLGGFLYSADSVDSVNIVPTSGERHEAASRRATPGKLRLDIFLLLFCVFWSDGTRGP